MTDITTIISTVGFPIAMCLCLMWFVKFLIDSHKQESLEFTTALNNNTLALQKLITMLENDKERKEES